MLRLSLLILAFDIWLLMVRRASRYGAADFNVAHFSWLDAVQPMPTPSLYAALLLLCGGLAFVQAIVGLRRPLMIAATALYTYGWAMSLQDAYQHHYLISLVMLCFCLFPDDRGRPRTVVAWGYQLLLATISVVYAYAMISKLDSLWWGGSFLAMLTRNKPAIMSVVKQLQGSGLEPSTLWWLLAAVTIALEGFLSLAYLAALFRDRPLPAAPIVPSIAGLAVFFLAANMHIGIEVFGLRIGWFSFYMIAWAAVVFLPVSWLEAAARLVGLGSRLPEKKKAPPRKGRPQKDAPATRAPSPIAAAVAAAAGVACLVLAGLLLDVPGATYAGVAGAVALIAGVALLMRRKAVADAIRFSLVSGGAALVCWLAIASSSTREALDRWYQIDQQRRGAQAATPEPDSPGDND